MRRWQHSFIEHHSSRCLWRTSERIVDDDRTVIAKRRDPLTQMLMAFGTGERRVDYKMF